jgi:hypothetical protein
MDDRDLLVAFEHGSFKPGELTHERHVRVAWLILQREPLEQAIETLRGGFRRFAKSIGQPEIYHETMTCAFAILIDAAMHECGDKNDWIIFRAENPQLFRGVTLLNEHYESETLNSDEARQTFVLPDLKELPCYV